jgi:hypothetical protein
MSKLNRRDVVKGMAGIGVAAWGSSIPWSGGEQITGGQDQLFESYRILRRGLLTLPALEKSLANDLRLLGPVVERQKSPKLELEFGLQVISTTRELVDQTLAASKILRQFADNNDLFANAETFEQLVSKRVQDPEVIGWIFRILRRHGGVRKLLQYEEVRLARKLYSYSKSIDAAAKRDVPSFQLATQILADHYATELQRELAYWRQRLESADSPQQRFEVIWELCHEAPEVARLLNVQCPEDIPWPVILIAIACAILLAHD